MLPSCGALDSEKAAKLGKMLKLLPSPEQQFLWQIWGDERLQVHHTGAPRRRLTVSLPLLHLPQQYTCDRTFDLGERETHVCTLPTVQEEDK